MSAKNIRYCVNILSKVCTLAGPTDLIADIRYGLVVDGVYDAILNGDDATIFEWLLTIFCLQGISDQAAFGYIKRAGLPGLHEIYNKLRRQPRCEKLHSYWQLSLCGYLKSKNTCNEMALLQTCPLPHLDLRNGRLNQTAFSLALFLRDLTKGDFVRWLRQRVHAIRNNNVPIEMGLLAPLSNIFGVSDKTVRLALSELLIGVGHFRGWRELGGNIIVVDSLVHNFLHRTGILRRQRAIHTYGPACYRKNGCLTVLQDLSTRIDARMFNSDYPSNFPRFVQKSIWNFCAFDEMNICNGNKIKDTSRCGNSECQLYSKCDRVRLAKNRLNNEI